MGFGWFLPASFSLSVEFISYLWESENCLSLSVRALPLQSIGAESTFRKTYCLTAHIVGGTDGLVSLAWLQSRLLESRNLSGNVLYPVALLYCSGRTTPLENADVVSGGDYVEDSLSKI